MKERLNKLLTVKSIVTVLFTILFFIVALKGNIPQEVLSIYTMIIGFYFGTQAKKE